MQVLQEVTTESASGLWGTLDKKPTMLDLSASAELGMALAGTLMPVVQYAGAVAFMFSLKTLAANVDEFLTTMG